jgi:uncharacterized membrane protein YqjE
MLLTSLKALGRTVSDIMRTRIEILSLDMQEYRLRLISLLMLSAFSFLFLMLSLVIGAFWLISSIGEEYRPMAMGILAAALLVCGLAFLGVLAWKLRKGPEPFHGSVAELKKDGFGFIGADRRLE